MRLIRRILALNLMLITLIGCQPDEEVYVQVIQSGDSSVVFRIGGDEHFETHGTVHELSVYRQNTVQGQDRLYWDFIARGDVKVSEVVYGVTPGLFRERHEARPLESTVNYCVEVRGRFSEPAIVCFTYQQ